MRHAEKQQGEGEEQKEKYGDYQKEHEQGIFSQKIENIFSYAFYRGVVTVVHPAFNVFCNIEEAGAISLFFDITAHIDIFAGFFPESLAPAYRVKHFAFNNDELADCGGKPRQFDKPVRNRGMAKPVRKNMRGIVIISPNDLNICPI